MVLERLTEDNFMNLKDRKIGCYGSNIRYIQELSEKFNLLDDISFIIDDNNRRDDEINICGKVIPVYSDDNLNELNADDVAIIITSDYFNEVYDKLLMREFCHKLANIYYFLDKETECELNYRLKYADLPLENIIIFRSGPHASSYVKGMDFSDNARALFEYMLRNEYNRTYKLVWIVNDPKDYKKYNSISNVEFVSWNWSLTKNELERDRYYRNLCLAKYIFFTDAYGFARNCRHDQIRIQLWHGCGFKTRINFSRCENRYEFMTVISDLYADIHQDIYGLRKEQLLITGYAKTDWLFGNLKVDRLRGLEIPRAKKYIFWLPTFRTAHSVLVQLNEQAFLNETGFPVINTMEELECLNQELVNYNVVLIIKLHPFQRMENICSISFSNIFMLKSEFLYDEDIQINELLPLADALISDYSSVAVDYLLLDRPIAFTLDDVKEYEESRGFVFDNINDWLPGKEIYSMEDFYRFVEEIAVGIDSTKEKRGILRDKMHKFHDGLSCSRILKALHIQP